MRIKHFFLIFIFLIFFSINVFAITPTFSNQENHYYSEIIYFSLDDYSDLSNSDIITINVFSNDSNESYFEKDFSKDSLSEFSLFFKDTFDSNLVVNYLVKDENKNIKEDSYFNLILEENPYNLNFFLQDNNYEIKSYFFKDNEIYLISNNKKADLFSINVYDIVSNTLFLEKTTSSLPINFALNKSGDYRLDIFYNIDGYRFRNELFFSIIDKNISVQNLDKLDDSLLVKQIDDKLFSFTNDDSSYDYKILGLFLALIILIIFILIPKDKENRREKRKLKSAFLFFIVILFFCLFSFNVFSLPENNLEINSFDFSNIFSDQNEYTLIITPEFKTNTLYIPIDFSNAYGDYNISLKKDSNICDFYFSIEDVYLLNNLNLDRISQKDICYSLVNYLEQNNISNEYDLFNRTKNKLLEKTSNECFDYLTEQKIISAFPLFLKVDYSLMDENLNYNKKENLELEVNSLSFAFKDMSILFNLLFLDNQEVYLNNYYNSDLDLYNYSLKLKNNKLDLNNSDLIYSFAYENSNFKLSSFNLYNDPSFSFKNNLFNLEDRTYFDLDLNFDYSYISSLIYLNKSNYILSIFNINQNLEDIDKIKFIFDKDDTYFRLKKNGSKIKISINETGIPYISDIESYFYKFNEDIYYYFNISIDNLEVFIFDKSNLNENVIYWYNHSFSKNELLFGNLNNSLDSIFVDSVILNKDNLLSFLIDIDGDKIYVTEGKDVIYNNYLIKFENGNLNIYYKENIDLSKNISQKDILDKYDSIINKDYNNLELFNTMIYDISNGFNLSFRESSAFWALSYYLNDINSNDFSKFFNYDDFCSQDVIYSKYNQFDEVLNSVNFKYFKYNFFNIETNFEGTNYIYEAFKDSNEFTINNYSKLCNLSKSEDISTKNFVANIFLISDMLSLDKDNYFKISNSNFSKDILIDLDKYDFYDFFITYLAYKNLFLDLEKQDDSILKNIFIDNYYKSTLDFRILPLKYNSDDLINNILENQNSVYSGNCSMLSADSLNMSLNIPKDAQYLKTVDAWYRVVDSSSISVWFEDDNYLNLEHLFPGMILGIRINNDKYYTYENTFVNPDWFDIPQKYKDLGYYTYDISKKTVKVPYTHVVSYIGEYDGLKNQILNRGDFEINVLSIYDYVPRIKEKSWVYTEIVEVFLPSNFYDDEELINIRNYLKTQNIKGILS